jgi:hypothetical protein
LPFSVSLALAEYYSIIINAMARAINIIRKDLVAIEEKVEQLFREIHYFYGQYLNLLSQSVRRQLIVACYHICTQIYPQPFLNLSFDKRHKFQNNLKQLSKETQGQLLSYLATSLSPETEEISEAQEEAETEPAVPTPSDSLILPKITNPEELFEWCKSLEKGIQKTLENLSQNANNQLQQTGILPSRLPSRILEMALQAEESGTAVNQTPNLLDLMVEIEKKEGNSRDKITEKPMRITAVRLRLSEIEFADPALSVARNQIRDLLDTVKKIRQQYRQVQQDYAIAQAEAAWRSSWSENY